MKERESPAWVRGVIEELSDSLGFRPRFDWEAPARDQQAFKLSQRTLERQVTPIDNGTMTGDRAWIALDRGQCIELLRTARYGRLATTARALPTILPVAIELHEEDLSLWPLLSADVQVIPDQVVALETGDLFNFEGAAWSVVVRGMLDSNVRSGNDLDEPGACGLIAPSGFRLATEFLSGWSSIGGIQGRLTAP